MKTNFPQKHYADRIFCLIPRYEFIPRDGVIPYFDFSKECLINFPDREDWLNEDSLVEDGAETWFTDGSVMESKAGAGAFCSNTGEAFQVSLGKMATIFQAELFAISMVLSLALERSGCSKLVICSDSQASLRALDSCVVRSRQIAECRSLIAAVSRFRAVQLMWVPGHMGVSGNEMADALARQGSAILPVGPEPFIPVPASFFKREVTKKVRLEIARSWEAQNLAHSGEFIHLPSGAESGLLLNLRRELLRTVISFLTGHGPFKVHLAKIGVGPTDVLCKCGLEDETARHLICECPLYWFDRGEWFGRYVVSPQDIRESSLKTIVGFVKAYRLSLRLSIDPVN
jgi:ribonuclease HI